MNINLEHLIHENELLKVSKKQLELLVNNLKTEILKMKTLNCDLVEMANDYVNCVETGCCNNEIYKKALAYLENINLIKENKEVLGEAKGVE